MFISLFINNCIFLKYDFFFYILKLKFFIFYWWNEKDDKISLLFS